MGFINHSYSYMGWLLLIAAGINSSIGNLLLKQSRIVNNSITFLDSLISLWFLGGMFFYGVNVLLFVKALERLDVSIAYPVLAGIGFLLTIVLANNIFGEQLSLGRVIGITFIVIGIALLSH